MGEGRLNKVTPVPTRAAVSNHQSSWKKAFTLIEMLFVITVLPFIMVSVSGVYATFIRDIPRTTRTLQQNTTVLDLLRQLAQDMDRATGLPGSFDGETAGARRLLIEQRGRVVSYQFEPGRVVRTLLKGRGPSTADEERLWRMRDAVITWRLWERDGGAYALEVHSHIEERFQGLIRQMLANSHVFFVHGLGKGSEAL